MTTSEQDLVGSLRNGRFRLRGWHQRYKKCPMVEEQAKIATEGAGYQLLFRGDKELPFGAQGDEVLFVLGLKSKPLYHADDPETWDRHPRAIAEDEEEFRVLAYMFAATHMGRQRNARVDPEKVLREWEGRDLRGRTRLAQLLLYGIHCQNTRLGRSSGLWTSILPYLFVRSASTSAEVAAKYAIGAARGGESPCTAVVLEYAPPIKGHLFEMVSDVVDEFNALHLGQFFPDRDGEALIPFGMLPHYLLGYSKLNRNDSRTPSDEVVYDVRYVPNPSIATEGFTLERPKPLDEEQTSLREELNGQVALVYHDWTGSKGEWIKMVGQGQTADISGSQPNPGRPATPPTGPCRTQETPA